MCRFPHQDFMSSSSPLLKTSGSFTMRRHPKVHGSFLASYPGLPHGLGMRLESFPRTQAPPDAEMGRSLGTRLESFPTLRFNVVIRLSIFVKPCYQATCTCILASFPGIHHSIFECINEGNISYHTNDVTVCT